MIPYIWLERAQDRIAPYIIETPLTHEVEDGLYIKWENHQVTGSFKARGAINKVLTLQPWERERGIVTASAGNHGQGVALAGKLVGAPIIVYASEHAAPVKIQAMRELGAEIRLVPGGYGEAEQAGLEYAATSGATWISAYNDGQVIAGQGTLGLEITRRLQSHPNITWIIPGSGGGLIAGVGASIKSTPHGNVAHKLIGVQSEASAFMYHLYHYGNQEDVIEYQSLADGLSGPVEENSITIPLVRKYADNFILVTEDEIIAAIRFAWHRYNERIEGAAAAALAAVLSDKISDRPVVVVISGGNIQAELHTKIVTGNQ